MPRDQVDGRDEAGAAGDVGPILHLRFVITGAGGENAIRIRVPASDDPRARVQSFTPAELCWLLGRSPAAAGAMTGFRVECAVLEASQSERGGGRLLIELRASSDDAKGSAAVAAGDGPRRPPEARAAACFSELLGLAAAGARGIGGG